MNDVIGVSLLIGGGFALWFGGHIWHGAKENQKKHWLASVVLLLILAGLGIAGGASLLGFLGFLGKEAGAFPLWLIVALAAGIWLLVDLVMRHGWTRTPVLAFITAAMIAVPVAPALTAHQAHTQGPQLTSVSRKG
jgi:hypothetical protein